MAGSGFNGGAGDGFTVTPHRGGRNIAMNARFDTAHGEAVEVYRLRRWALGNRVGIWAHPRWLGDGRDGERIDEGLEAIDKERVMDGSSTGRRGWAGHGSHVMGVQGCGLPRFHCSQDAGGKRGK
jgi:hypothetical protein